MREMKDSGIEWIGEIPADWKIQPLKTISIILRGGSPRPIEEYMSADDNGYNWIRIGDSVKGSKYITSTLRKLIPEGLSKTRLIKKGSLILSNSMSFGQPYILGIDGCIHDGWVAFSEVTVNNEFLYYFLLSEMAKIQFQQQVAGGVVLNLNVDKIGTTKIAIPDSAKQASIVNFLDTECARIDAVIEQTRSSIEEYKKLKQAIITQAVTKGVRPGRPMKDSGIEWIGEIAADFDLQKLKYLTDILDQFRSPITADQRNQNAEVLYDYYGASGAIDKIDGYTIDDHVMLIGEDGANLRMRNLPLMYEVNGKAWINNHAHILKPKESTHFYYLFYALESININPYITGSAQPKLSQENLKNIWLPVPSYEEQAEIANYLQVKMPEMDALIAKKNAFVEALENYKHSIIYEYVTGKKEVPSAPIC